MRCTSGYASQQTINIFRTLYNSWETRIQLSLIVDCVDPSSVLGYYKHLNIVCSLIWPQLFCNFYLFYLVAITSSRESRQPPLWFSWRWDTLSSLSFTPPSPASTSTSCWAVFTQRECAVLTILTCLNNGDYSFREQWRAGVFNIKGASHPHPQYVLCPIIKCFPWHSFEHVNNDSRPGVWWREYQSCHKEILGRGSVLCPLHRMVGVGDCVCLGRCCDQRKQRPMEGRWSQWKFKMHNLQRNWILAPTAAGLMNWWGTVTAAVVRGT